MIWDPLFFTVLVGWSIFAPFVGFALGWWTRGGESQPTVRTLPPPPRRPHHPTLRVVSKPRSAWNGQVTTLENDSHLTPPWR